MIQALSMQFHVIVGIAQCLAQAIKLQLGKRVARQGFNLTVEIAPSIAAVPDSDF